MDLQGLRLKKKVIAAIALGTLGCLGAVVLAPKKQAAAPPWLSSIYQGQTRADLISLLGKHGKSFLIRSTPSAGVELVEINPTRDWSLLFTQTSYGLELVGGKVQRAWRSEVFQLDRSGRDISLPKTKPTSPSALVP